MTVTIRHMKSFPHETTAFSYDCPRSAIRFLKSLLFELGGTGMIRVDNSESFKFRSYNVNSWGNIARGKIRFINK